MLGVFDVGTSEREKILATKYGQENTGDKVDIIKLLLKSLKNYLTRFASLFLSPYFFFAPFDSKWPLP